MTKYQEGASTKKIFISCSVVVSTCYISTVGNLRPGQLLLSWLTFVILDYYSSPGGVPGLCMYLFYVFIYTYMRI